MEHDHLHSDSLYGASGPRTLGVCAYCEELISDSEPRLREQDGRLFHAECLESLPLTELLAVFGIEVDEEG